MELKNLRSFVYVAETESFSEAATRLNISQSAVSRHVLTLEQEFDTPLLIRHAKYAVLTEIGKELYTRARRIVTDTDDCIEHINSLNGSLTGELRIGIGSFIEPYIRHAALRMMDKFPGVRLNAEFGKACRLNQMLRERKIDLAFTMNTAKEDEGISSERCIPFHIRAVMSRSHALADRDIISVSDLYKHKVMMPDVGERVFQTVQRYVDADLSKLKVKAIVSSAYAVLNVLDDANVITFLPDLYLKEGNPYLIAKPIEGLEKCMYSNVHWMSDVPMKKSAQEFVKIVREYSVPLMSLDDDNL